MIKNILSLNDFKGKKSGATKINEMVDAIDDVYRVSVDVDIPKGLISSYIKKVKESTGKDLRADMGEKRLAERLVQWANENYLNIENLPIEIVTGSDRSPVQAQSQSQVQAQGQLEETPEGEEAQTQPVQAQSQVQVQPIQNSQVQKPNVQVQGQAQGQAQGQVQRQGQAQTAAAQIPAQEI
jgi:hypothetical protein